MTDLGIAIRDIQIKARAVAEESKPETWTCFESQVMTAPFPSLVARLGEAK